MSTEIRPRSPVHGNAAIQPSDVAAHLRAAGRHIALDATTKYMDRGGSGVHTTELSAALRRVIGDTLVEVAYPWSQPPSTPRTGADRVHTIARDLWWANLGAPRAARACDLLHVPVPYGPLFGRMPVVVTVHDCFVLRTPERFRRWMRMHQGATMPRLLRRAEAIIASSTSTKEDILALTGARADRIHVIPCGVRRQFQPIPPHDPRLERVRARYDLPPRFVLSVGQVEPRKNLARLVRAVTEASHRPGAEDVVLVHAGPAGWLSEELEQVLRTPEARTRTKFLGFVPDEDLPPLYAAADALAYPSLGEGFGFPIVEAMAVGTPVLTANVSSMPEVAGDAAVLVDPLSVDAIADGLHRLWTDAALRAQLSARGFARIPRFDWDAIARQTCEVYANVLG